MSFALWPTTFVARFTAVTAAFLNQVRLDLSRAVDGAGGGDYAPSTAVNFSGAEGLKAARLRLTTATGANSRIQLAPRQITRFQPLVAVEPLGSATWQHTGAAWRNASDGGPGILAFPLTRLVHGQVLDELHVRWKGAGHGALPTMPYWELYKIDLDGTATLISTRATDTSANPGAYDAAHWISKTGIAHTVDLATYHYVLQVAGETGGNFAANALLSAIKALMTCTDMPEA